MIPSASRASISPRACRRLRRTGRCGAVGWGAFAGGFAGGRQSLRRGVFRRRDVRLRGAAVGHAGHPGKPGLAARSQPAGGRARRRSICPARPHRGGACPFPAARRRVAQQHSDQLGPAGRQPPAPIIPPLRPPAATTPARPAAMPAAAPGPIDPGFGSAAALPEDGGFAVTAAIGPGAAPPSRRPSPRRPRCARCRAAAARRAGGDDAAARLGAAERCRRGAGRWRWRGAACRLPARGLASSPALCATRTRPSS